MKYLLALLLLAITIDGLGQTAKQQPPPVKRERIVTVVMAGGEKVQGSLSSLDNDTVTVKNSVGTTIIELDKVARIEFNGILLMKDEAAQPAQPTKPALPASKVTLANFLKLEIGMPYKAVAEILGAPGVEQARSGDRTALIVSYQWRDGKAGNIIAMFINGKLSHKAQAELR